MPVRITTRPQPLVLAVGATTRDLAVRVAMLLNGEPSVSDPLPQVIETPGAALRLAYRLSPDVLCACVGVDRVGLAGVVLHALHQRRPELTVVAVAREQDADLERVVRASGASVYLPISGETDETLLRDTIESLTSISPRGHPPNHTGLSPPTIRAGPPVLASLHVRALRK
jgi:hypothetical protein